MSMLYRQRSGKRSGLWRTSSPGFQPPVPSRTRSEMVQPHTSGLTASDVTSYLKYNPAVLDQIILSLGTNKIKFLIRTQEQRSARRELRWISSTDTQKICPGPLKHHLLSSIKIQSQSFLKESREPDLKKVIYNAADVLASTLLVDWFSLYFICHNNTKLCEYTVEGEKCHSTSVKKGTTVSAEAAFLGETRMVTNLPENIKYPKGVGHPDRNVQSVLSIPLVCPSGDTIGVIELCRSALKRPFGTLDLLICNWMLGWMLCSIHQGNMNRILDIQSKLNDYILDLTKGLFFSMTSIDHLVEKILSVSKELVHADRCNMFLINKENNQFYAEFFYQSLSNKGKKCFVTKKQLHFSLNTGLPGYVYKTGKPINVYDAYADKRFSPTVDEVTGYRTKNVLCMPIIGKGRVVGVIEMLNSLSNEHFTRADELAFKTFSVYCALALFNYRIHNELSLSQAQCRTTMEVLQYHIVSAADMSRTEPPASPPKTIPESFYSYDFNPYLHEKHLHYLFNYMIDDMFGENVFDFNTMSRFIQTVMQNYQPLPYHNWMHGFQVAHALYCMVKTNSNTFSMKETMALVIAGVCHDLNHRGYSNVFCKQFDLPLADLYSTSLSTELSYKFTATILQLEGHEIFSFLSTFEHKEMLQMIHDAILATDLSLYINTQTQVTNMIENQTFDIEDEECRTLFKALMMAAADLSSVAMPWNTQEELITRLCSEFYMNDVAERECSLNTYKKNFEKEIPKQQVYLIRFICKPLYTTMVNILPGSRPLLEGTMLNLEKWMNIAAKKAKEKLFEPFY